MNREKVSLLRHSIADFVGENHNTIAQIEKIITYVNELIELAEPPPPPLPPHVPVEAVISRHYALYANNTEYTYISFDEYTKNYSHNILWDAGDPASIQILEDGVYTINFNYDFSGYVHYAFFVVEVNGSEDRYTTISSSLNNEVLSRHAGGTYTDDFIKGDTISFKVKTTSSTHVLVLPIVTRDYIVFGNNFTVHIKKLDR